MVEAHLEGLDDDDFDYEEAEADLQPPLPPPPAPVKEEEDEDAPRGDDFPMSSAWHSDWSKYQGSYTDYVEPLPWALALCGAMYQQAVAEDPPETTTTSTTRRWRRTPMS
jgi:hypothetical protein